MSGVADQRVLVYRPEIDGLRAVAVMAIMLFHAEFGLLPGGYTGVDIFFVISGFLITTMILRADEQAGFSLAAFYLRRLRRIAPALLLVMLGTIPFALAWMMPDQLQDYGQSLVATTVMSNNALLWLTDGYWSQPTSLRPLAHTWTLAVEEQFYLLLPPLMVVLLHKRGRRGLVTGLVLAGAVSLTLAQYMSGRDAEATFLLLPTRFWELAVGALAGVAHGRAALVVGRWRPWLATIGAVCGIAPIVLFDAGEAVPSLPTLIPVAGCAVFLLFGRADEGVGRILAMRPFVAIGLVSYGAYLFHQPVFAFARLLAFQEPSPLAMAWLVPVVLFCAALSWHYVERPFRDSAKVSDRALLLLCAGGALLVVTVGLVLHLTDGFAARWAALGGYGEAGRPTRNIAYVDAPYRYSGTRLDPRARPTNVLFVGPSFARDAINMARESGQITPDAIAYVAALGCNPGAIDRSLAYAPLVDTVVIATSMRSNELDCFARWAKRLAMAGVGHVRIIGPKQFGYSMAAVVRLPEAERYTMRLVPDDGVRTLNQTAAARLPRNIYVDLFALMDQGDGKVPVYTPDRLLVSMDGRHLTPAGARWLGDLIFATPAFAHLRRGPGSRYTQVR